MKKDTQVSLVKNSDRRISSQSKIVSHHSLTLKNRKHLTHFVELTHSAESCGSRYKAIFFTKQSVLVNVAWQRSQQDVLRNGRTLRQTSGPAQRKTEWGSVKEQHLSALISVMEQRTLSKALHPFLIQWCCSVGDGAAHRQHWLCLHVGCCS